MYLLPFWTLQRVTKNCKPSLIGKVYKNIQQKKKKIDNFTTQSLLDGLILKICYSWWVSFECIAITAYDNPSEIYNYQMCLFPALAKKILPLYNHELSYPVFFYFLQKTPHDFKQCKKKKRNRSKRNKKNFRPSLHTFFFCKPSGREGKKNFF